MTAGHEMLHAIDRNDDADRLLDIRVELLSATWQEFIDREDPAVLMNLRAGEMLQRRAQRIARRPVRRRREGDDGWSDELDGITAEGYVSGRLHSEIARAVDRPTPLTMDRLHVLGFPSGLWPAWDEVSCARRDALINAGLDLSDASHMLRRSPWDIALSLLADPVDVEYRGIVSGGVVLGM